MWRVKLAEELATAYPMLDRNMIQIAIEFDEQMQEKYGADYRWEDHKDELIPKPLQEDLNSTLSTEPESSETESTDQDTTESADGQGQTSSTGTGVQ